MAFASETRVLVNSTDEKPINDFIVGDIVYAADGTNASDWKQRVVQFSAGTGEGSRQSVMVYLVYMLKDEQRSIVVTQDQPFLTSEKQIKRAEQIVPGVDQLLSANGESIQILMVTMGAYNRGVSDVAITTSFEDPGHWIIANGLVCGDYRIQLGQE